MLTHRPQLSNAKTRNNFVSFGDEIEQRLARIGESGELGLQQGDEIFA
jgi:hypothetical protein